MKYKINKGLIHQKIKDKLIIFDAEKSVLYTFNSSALFIFIKIKSKWDEKKIISAMVEKYGIRQGIAKTDLVDFIHQLKKNKIIVGSEKN